MSEIQYFFATLQVECIAFQYFCCFEVITSPNIAAY